MPYESFKCSHQLSIRGLVQDRRTGSWRYLIQVRRVLQDADACSLLLQSPVASTRAVRWQRSGSCSSYATASPSNSSAFGASGAVYTIRRSFAEFKALHAAMAPLMVVTQTLPSLPVDSILAFFVGETQTMLQKKRLVLENILIAIERHALASDATAYLEFVARTDTYEHVAVAPASPPPPSRSHSKWGRTSPEPSTSSVVMPPPRYHSDDVKRQRGRPHTRRRRRLSSDNLSIAATPRSADKTATTTTTMSPVETQQQQQENRIHFHRYSLV